MGLLPLHWENLTPPHSSTGRSAPDQGVTLSLQWVGAARLLEPQVWFGQHMKCLQLAKATNEIDCRGGIARIAQMSALPHVVGDTLMLHLRPREIGKAVRNSPAASG